MQPGDFEEVSDEPSRPVQSSAPKRQRVRVDRDTEVEIEESSTHGESMGRVRSRGAADYTEGDIEDSPEQASGMRMKIPPKPPTEAE